jgi:D-cysteine desulfhydrase
VAARYLGLDCHLILRNSRPLADADPGLAGNLLVERLAGAEIHQVTMQQQLAKVRSAARMLRHGCFEHWHATWGLCCLQVTKEEYQKVGSLQLGRQLEAELRAQGRNPYVIAVGGSTPLGNTKLDNITIVRILLSCWSQC